MPNLMAALTNIGGGLCFTPTTRVPCSNTAKTRNPLKFAGVPKLAKRSQPLVGRSLPYYQHMRRRYCCLTVFSDYGYMALFRRYSPTKLCDGAKMAIFLRRVFPASHVQHISDLHSKFAIGPHHVWMYGRHPICGR